MTFSFASFLLGAAVGGLAVGALTGLVVCWMLNLTTRRRTLAVDGVLGAAGLPLAYAALLRMPWQHTSLYHAGGTIITTTTLHYQHPIAAACGVAIVLPALHALGRFYVGKDRGP